MTEKILSAKQRSTRIDKELNPVVGKQWKISDSCRSFCGCDLWVSSRSWKFFGFGVNSDKPNEIIFFFAPLKFLDVFLLHSFKWETIAMFWDKAYIPSANLEALLEREVSWFYFIYTLFFRLFRTTLSYLPSVPSLPLTTIDPFFQMCEFQLIFWVFFFLFSRFICIFFRMQQWKSSLI